LLPWIKVNNRSWYQNMMFKPADDAVPTTDASDTYQHLQAWQMLQQMQMTELTYEKYLETFGVQSVNPSQGNPEILRFSRSWTQPVNTIEPTTGAPSSAWVWNDEIKMDKPKRFEEPGFVLTLAAVRPKLFAGGVDATLCGNLWGFSDWYPSYNLNDPTAGVREILGNDPVFTTPDATPETLIYDHRDLLSHGEQFVNSTDAPYDLPINDFFGQSTGAITEQIRQEYAGSTAINNLFANPTFGNAVCYYDGIIQSQIAGHVTDTTR